MANRNEGHAQPKSPSASDPVEARKVAAETARIVTVRAPAATMTQQHLSYFVGISRNTAGATGLSMHLVVIPRASPPSRTFTADYETAIYLLEGRRTAWKWLVACSIRPRTSHLKNASVPR